MNHQEETFVSNRKKADNVTLTAKLESTIPEGDQGESCCEPEQSRDMMNRGVEVGQELRRK